MKTIVYFAAAALAGAGVTTTAQATVLYKDITGHNVNGTYTPDVTSDPGPSVSFSLSFNPTAGKGGGVLIDELAGGGVWNDNQLEVESDGTVLGSVYNYSSVLNLGHALFGKTNVATFSYNDATGLFSGLLNGVASQAQGTPGSRDTPFASGYTDVYYGLGSFAGGASLGSGQAFAGTIANVIITNGVAAAVPEAGTWAMMLVGFAAISVVVRQRRQAMAVRGYCG